jgi:membrane protein implicated in regulation of membrane protease activity
MTWWAWVLLGVALLVVEMVTPGGLFALFFGIGAIAVGVLAALGLAGPPWMEWLLFAGLSVVLLAVLRKRLRGKLGAPGLAAELAGEVAVVVADIAPGGVGKAELRGTPWEARAAGPGPISAGQRCRVERVDGLMLVLRPE